jgi:general secretion pathway protein D
VNDRGEASSGAESMNRPRSGWSRRAGLLAVAATLAVAGAAWGQNNPPATPAPAPAAPAVPEDPNEMIHVAIDSEGVNIDQFIKLASDRTHRPFLLAPALENTLGKRKVKITQSTDVPRKDLFEFFKAVLKANDLVLFPVGPRSAELYIVDDLKAAGPAGSLRAAAVFVAEDELEDWRDRTAMISTVIPLKYIDITRARQELGQLVNTRNGAAITNVSSVNALIVTDFAPTVYAIYQILTVMDQKEARYQLLFKKIPLQFAVAEELQPIITDLVEGDSGSFGGGRGGGGGGGGAVNPGGGGGGLQKPSAKIIPEPRTNSIVVYAVQEDLEKIEDLINKLDEDVKGVPPNIHRYQLKHAVAEDVQNTLSEIVQGGSRSSGGFSSRASRGQRGAAQPALGGGAGGSSSNQAVFQEGEIQIVAEPHTNSLLIRASKTQYAWLKELIADIDQRLPQVLIESAIVELSQDFSDVFGVELASIDNRDDTPFGLTGFGLSRLVNITGNGTVDPNAGFPNARIPDNLSTGGLTGGIFNANQFQIPFILQAIQTNTNANLLSMPSVLTNDNAGASITVSMQQTTTTSSVAGTGFAQGGFGGFVEAPITLSISPHISSDDYLRLDVLLDVQSFTGSEQRIPTGGGGVQIVPSPKTQRRLQTQITVPNASTIVIGGLRQTNDTDTVQKVPLLGDLPLIGWLFRATTTRQMQTTLYLFLTPHILKDHDFKDIYSITYQKELEVKKLIGADIKLIDNKFKEIDLAAPNISIQDIQQSPSLEVPRYSVPPVEPPKEEGDVPKTATERQDALEPKKQESSDSSSGKKNHS